MAEGEIFVSAFEKQYPKYSIEHDFDNLCRRIIFTLYGDIGAEHTFNGIKCIQYAPIAEFRLDEKDIEVMQHNEINALYFQMFERFVIPDMSKTVSDNKDDQSDI